MSCADTRASSRRWSLLSATRCQLSPWWTIYIKWLLSTLHPTAQQEDDTSQLHPCSSYTALSSHSDQRLAARDFSFTCIYCKEESPQVCSFKKKEEKKPQFQSGYSIIYYSRFQSPTAMPELFCCEHVTYKLQRPASTTWANHHSCTTPPLGLHQTGQSSAKGDISSPAQAAQVETMFDQTITKLRGQINNSPLSTQLQPVSSSPNSPWRSTALCCYRHDALSAQRRPCILYSRLKC